MSLAHSHDTVPAHPLGIPVDGRERYGMTPEQAALYQWLIRNRPTDGLFQMRFRQICKARSTWPNRLHQMTENLVARGWLHKEGRRYCFVKPVMHFKAPR